MPPASHPPAFSDRPLPRAVIEDVLALARRAPSGVNTQPWNVYVVQGNTLSTLKSAAVAALALAQTDASAQARFWAAFRRLPGHSHWDGPAWETQGGGFAGAANAAFGAGRIHGNEDLSRYFDLWGAPVLLMCTIDRSLGLGSVLDYGMFLQTIVVAAQGRGFRAEVQAGWRGLADAVLPLLQLQPGEGPLLLAGVALGYPADAQLIAAATPVPADSFTTWHG